MGYKVKKRLIVLGIILLLSLILLGCTKTSKEVVAKDSKEIVTTETATEEETAALPEQNNQCKQILVNGNPQQKINFVFISDGFTTETEFMDKVEEFISLNNASDILSFLNYYPFSQFKRFYNIYAFYEPSIDWGCDAQINMGIYHDLCADRVKVLDKVAEYCSWGLESDYLIILSNKDYRSFADSFGLEELEKVRHLGISTPATRDMLPLKKMFLHELSHSFGQLSDEYIDARKDQYKPIAGIGAKNIDVVGCPKWCSGTMNTSIFAYSIYQDYLTCINGLDVWNLADDAAFLDCETKPFEPLEMNNCLLGKKINDENIMACFRSIYPSDPDETIFSNCYIDGSKWVCNQGFAQNVDLGLNCLSGNGCYWGAGGTNGFRSSRNSLMRNHEDPQGSLGPYNEKIVKENINRMIQEKQVNINKFKIVVLELSNSSFPVWWINAINDPLQIPFKVIFKTLNQDDQAVIINNNVRNYITSASDGIINKNVESGNLELYFTYMLNKKIGQTQINPGDFKDITFNIKSNDIGLNETYRFYVSDLTFKKI